MSKRYTEPMLENDIEIVPASSTEAKIRLSFYSEHDDTQREFEKLARAQKTEALSLYAKHLFNRALEASYDAVIQAQAKTFKAAAICIMAQGKAKTLAEAYAVLGYTPTGQDREV